MAVRPGGTVVLMGGSGVSLDLPYRHLMRNNITIRGQWMYPRHAVPNMIRLAEGGFLPSTSSPSMPSGLMTQTRRSHVPGKMQARSA
nr:hypothetical protein [Marinicella sp. W31]MDC2875569.1 hypothetical protein [Marinicella sp. W31]